MAKIEKDKFKFTQCSRVAEKKTGKNKKKKRREKKIPISFSLAVYSQYIRILNLNSQNSRTGQLTTRESFYSVTKRMLALGIFTRYDGRLDEE